MFVILLVMHIIVCIFLIAVILLQAGRGGGLSEAFGGSAESVLGTQAPTVLKKATTVSAVLFLVLSLLLAMIAARRGKSLFQQMAVPVAPQVPYSTDEAIPLAIPEAAPAAVPEAAPAAVPETLPEEE